jgi:hypothetical protein
MLEVTEVSLEEAPKLMQKEIEAIIERQRRLGYEVNVVIVERFITRNDDYFFDHYQAYLMDQRKGYHIMLDANESWIDIHRMDFSAMERLLKFQSEKGV